MSKRDFMHSTSTEEKLTKDGGTPEWSIVAFKGSKDGEVVISATEGSTRKVEGGFTSFAFEMFSARRLEIRTGAKRMTAKLVESGVAQMRRKLIQEGLAFEPEARKDAA